MKVTSLVSSVRMGAAALALALLTPALQADQQVTASYLMPMSINAIVDESDCQNSPGPQITLGGEIRMGGLKARVIFSNNVKGTHTTTVVSQYDVNLLIGGGSITIAKQPVLGGVGGNPFIYLQFHDGKGNDTSEEFLLGRCVQGLTVTADVLNEVLAHANVHAEGCSNRKGPFITLDGDLKLSGLHAKF